MSVYFQYPMVYFFIVGVAPYLHIHWHEKWILTQQLNKQKRRRMNSAQVFLCRATIDDITVHEEDPVKLSNSEHGKNNCILRGRNNSLDYILGRCINPMK
jgi:hypothetical protein